MALADGVCVPREAMLLLALKYALGIEGCGKQLRVAAHEHPVKLISCPTGDTSLMSQYVIYVEGKRDEAVNADIQRSFRLNVLQLRAQGFDFIYIPSLIDEFGKMPERYVKKVICYMAPELGDHSIGEVYSRLLKMDTVTFCNYVLAEKLHVKEMKNVKPSLFINIGTSVVSYCSVSGPVECYTEFVCMPIDEPIETMVAKFLDDYKAIVSYMPVVAPSGHPHSFKYFGFYKSMFDFLAKAEPKVSDIVLHPCNSVFEFPQISLPDLVLSPQEAAVYKLIVHLTVNHSLGGQPTSYTKYQKDIDTLYKKIYCRQNATLPDNLAPICSRIESKMKKSLVGLANFDDFIPHLRDGNYLITARPERIKIRINQYQEAQNFLDHQWD